MKCLCEVKNKEGEQRAESSEAGKYLIFRKN